MSKNSKRSKSSRTINPKDSLESTNKSVANSSIQNVANHQSSTKKILSRRDLLNLTVPTIPAIFALFISNNANKISQESLEKVEYQETASFNLILNLWSNEPKILFINESNKKLAQVPSIEYILMIPSVITLQNKSNGNIKEFLVLSPVSYQNIQRQEFTGSTTQLISTWYLPKNFEGKLGERDVIYTMKTGYDPNNFFLDEVKDTLSEGRISEENEVNLQTYPFLISFTKVSYQYIGESETKNTDYFLNTPLIKLSLTQEEQSLIKEYIKLSHIAEASIEGEMSIYKSSHKTLIHMLDNNDSASINKLTSWQNETMYKFLTKILNSAIPIDPILIG